MLVDYHVHPNTFKDNRYLPFTDSLDRYIEVCKEKGISELGFAEHGPRFHPTYNHTALKMEEIPLYLKTLREFSREQDDVKVKIGIEIDYTPETEKVWRDMIGVYNFDFVACSIHFLDDWLPTNEGIQNYIRSGKTISQLYAKYYKTLQQAAVSQLFSFMAHPDLIKIHALVSHLPPPANQKELIEETCAVLQKHNQVIEFDTGWKKGDFDCYRPDKEFMKIALQYNIPITLGSDAHRAEDIGSYYTEGVDLLKEIGYTQICSFSKMKPVFHSLL